MELYCKISLLNLGDLPLVFNNLKKTKNNKRISIYNYYEMPYLKSI